MREVSAHISPSVSAASSRRIITIDTKVFTFVLCMAVPNAFSHEIFPKLQTSFLEQNKIQTFTHWHIDNVFVSCMFRCLISHLVDYTAECEITLLEHLCKLKLRVISVASTPSYTCPTRELYQTLMSMA